MCYGGAAVVLALPQLMTWTFPQTVGGGSLTLRFNWVNNQGKRFMNESIPGQQLENQIELQPDQITFQIYDSKWPEQIPYMPANHGGLCYIIPEDEDESKYRERER